MLDTAFNYFYLLFSIFVSVILWFSDSNKATMRFFISIHSVLLLITLGGVTYLSMYLQIYNNILLDIVFYTLLAVSILSVVTSFSKFTGPKWFLILHVWNLFALIATFFLGVMALSNDWL